MFLERSENYRTETIDISTATQEPCTGDDVCRFSFFSVTRIPQVLAPTTSRHSSRLVDLLHKSHNALENIPQYATW